MPEFFSFGMLDLVLSNLEFGSRNPEFLQRLETESKFERQEIRSAVPGIQSPQRGIQNLRMSWITLNEAIFFSMKDLSLCF